MGIISMSADEARRLGVQFPSNSDQIHVLACPSTRRGFLATSAATGIAVVTGAAGYHLSIPAKANDNSLAKIVEIAVASSVNAPWQSRGVPASYFKGMALVYGRVYCKLKMGDVVALDMAQASTGDTNRDALAWYEDKFVAAGLRNTGSSVTTLRHLFVLLIGLGIRESSGRYCNGRDPTAFGLTADTAGAGLFNVSFNASSANPLLIQLFNHYSASPSKFADVFKEQVRCSPSDYENIGSGDGARFQWLAKECPAFAVEVAGVGLRHIRKHWPSVNKRAPQVRRDVDDMLQEVQAVVDNSPSIHQMLLV
jgi:hypothetical protein